MAIPRMQSQSSPGSILIDRQIAQNPVLLGNLQEAGRGWMNQAEQYGQQMGNVAGGLANWNAQNPYMQQQQNALSQMAGGGFNPQQLQQFQNMFNPNTGTGVPPGAPGPPGPSPQMDIGFGQGYGGERPAPGGGPSGVMPYAPGAQQGGGGIPGSLASGATPQAGQTSGGNYGVPAGAMGGPDLTGYNQWAAQGRPGGNYADYRNSQQGGGQPQPQMGGGPPGGNVGGGASNPFGVGLNQAAGPGTTTGFTGTPTTAPTPQAPTQGAGGAYNEAMLGGGGFGADVGTAQQAQLGGLLKQAQAPGMTQGQQDQMFAAQYDPAAQAIGKSQNQALAQLSARGMGRSSAGVGNVEGERMQALGNVAQQAGANVTGQNLALTQRQSEFGLGGLGQFAGQGMQGALGMGNLGLGTEQLGTGNQLAMNQQQMQGQQQQFQQDNARAGMDLARYQTEQGFNMQQYQTDIQAAVASGRLDEQTAGRMAQNALQTTQQGLQAQGMQNQANQAYMNAALGAGGQALDYSGQNMQGQMAGGGMYGNAMGQFGGMGMDAYQMQQDFLRQVTQNQWQAYQNEYQRNAQGSNAAWGAAGQLFGAAGEAAATYSKGGAA